MSGREGRPLVVLGVYTVVTVVMTWPLALNLPTRLPMDLGDPLLNAWILSWNWTHLSALLHGHLGAMDGYWSAPIFHPEPLALAYSEHLFAQALEGLPVYLLTGSVVLAYNLLFLSTFVLSGLGAYLLVRDLTGNERAALLGGLLYTFAPYRMAHLGHLQVLSSEWLPFVLLGLRRWFDGVERVRRANPGRAPSSAPLLGAAAALVAQNLSCGYYLVFFAPFVVAYVLWEIGRRALWRSVRVWAALTTTAVAVAAATLPFLVPYLALRQHGFAPRSLEEVGRYSADVYSYLRGLDDSIWRRWLSDVTRAEGTLFPGLVPLALAALGVGQMVWRAVTASRTSAPSRGWAGLAARGLAGVVGAFVLLATFELFAGPLIKKVREVWEQAALVGNVLLCAALGGAGWLAVSPRARAAARWLVRSAPAFFALAALAAAWLSFGPYVETKGFRLTGPSIYVWLYRYLPGFDGLRAASRFAMLAVFCLSVLAGYGAAMVAQVRRIGGGLLPALGVLFLVEAASLPMPTAPLEWARRDTATPARPVSAGELTRLYDFAARLPPSAVVIELPFGELFDETRAVFFTTLHRHPLVNGYSGGFPSSYEARRSALDQLPAHQTEAWEALSRSGATCAVVHEWAFPGASGGDVSAWLESKGARLLGVFGRSKLYQLPTVG